MEEVYGRVAWRENTCRTCHRRFKTSRSDASYCSGRCRVYWQRHGCPYPGVGTPEQSGPGLFDQVLDAVLERAGVEKPIEPEPQPVPAEASKLVTPTATAKGVTNKRKVKTAGRSVTKKPIASKSNNKKQKAPTNKRKKNARKT
jgi:hypothetical protein